MAASAGNNVPPVVGENTRVFPLFCGDCRDSSRRSCRQNRRAVLGQSAKCRQEIVFCRAGGEAGTQLKSAAMQPDAEQIGQALRVFAPLRDAPRDCLARLQGETQLVRIAAGARLFDERASCSAFPLVLDGAIRVSKLTPQGREIMLYRVAPGESCVLTSACASARRASCRPTSGRNDQNPAARVSSRAPAPPTAWHPASLACPSARLRAFLGVRDSRIA